MVGIDNNMRREFFGAVGDTLWNLERLKSVTTNPNWQITKTLDDILMEIIAAESSRTAASTTLR